MISAILFVLLLPAMLGILPVVREWIAENREKASSGRTFRYRRFLTDQERGERRLVLAQYAERNSPLAWIRGIGGIWDGRICDAPIVHLQERPRLSLTIARIDAVNVSDTITIRSARYRQFRIVDPGRPWWQGTALLIDEEDKYGIDVLCRQLDETMQIERMRKAFGDPT